MSENVKDMINHAYNKDASGFEAAFNQVMADKMEVSLGAKFDSMYGSPAEESVEADLEPTEVEVEAEVEESVEETTEQEQ
jgi:uncharacterized SAM-dependent methyltransferase